MQEMRGRINLMHTDMPYAAMWEADLTPTREHLLYVSGLPAGSRIGDIVPRLESAGLGRARVHFRSSGTQVRRALSCCLSLRCSRLDAGSCQLPPGLTALIAELLLMLLERANHSQ